MHGVRLNYQFVNLSRRSISAVDDETKYSFSGNIFSDKMIFVLTVEGLTG